MLTGDLLVYTRRAGKIRPLMLDPADEGLRNMAQDLLSLFDAHRGKRRGDLDEALKAQPPQVQVKVFRGLAKLLLDSSEFTVSGLAEPREIRRFLFDGAAVDWRKKGREKIGDWRPLLINLAAKKFQLTPDQVENSMYADLQENQILEKIRPYTPEKLLYRYNVAQMQGMLLRAERLTLKAPSVAPRRLRQLYRYLKFFGLLFQVESQGADGFEMTLDGPLSLLQSGSRYGMNLAQFFPVLLNWEESWQLICQLTPRPGQGRALLELTPHPLLKSHYPDQGQWVPEELSRFLEGFASLDSPWRVKTSEKIVTLPGNRWLIPDLEFSHSQSKRRIYLEFLPYPSLERVEQRLEMVKKRGGEDYLLACRGVPSIQPLAENPWLFTFRRTLLPRPMKAYLDNLSGGGE